MAKQIMTLPELADYLDMPGEVLYRFIIHNDLQFPAYKVGREWCADLDDVQEWLLQIWTRKTG